MKKRIKLGYLYLIIPTLIFAGDETGKTGFEFLRADIGARPSAMGGAFGSVSGDLHGLMYNPASLVDIDGKQVAFTYLDYLLDIQSGFLGFHTIIDESHHASLGIAYIHYGEFRRTDIVGEDLGSFSPGDLIVSGSYGGKLTMGLRYGATLKFIHSKIDQYTSSGLALDLGVIYPIPEQNLTIGLSVQNIGTSIEPFIDTHERMPTSVRLGVSNSLAHLPLLINFNLIKYVYDGPKLTDGFYWALGGEFTISDNFLLRWGYNSRGRKERIGANDDRFAGFCFGMGIRIKRYHLDYGYGAFGILGQSNHLSVSIDL